MCGCGRTAPTEVITSAQAQEDIAARAAQDEVQMQESAVNALSNASTGWFVAAEAPAEVG